MTEKRRAEPDPPVTAGRDVSAHMPLPDFELPRHPWNDPDGDGHTCVDCPSESIWKCDEGAHGARKALLEAARERRLAHVQSLGEPNRMTDEQWAEAEQVFERQRERDASDEMTG